MTPEQLLLLFLVLALVNFLGHVLRRRARRAAAAARLRPWIGPRELRRAVVLSAILAPCRGLEPPPGGSPVS